jgi:hypothetical protein
VRRVLAVAAVVAAVAGAVLTFLTAPHLTVLNEGFRLEYGWTAIVATALAAVGAIGLAAVLRPVAARAGCALLAVAAVVMGIQRGAWQVGADRAALSARSLTDTSRIAWSEVRQAHSDTETLHVTGPGEAAIRIRLSALRPHDRATLERTISRRVQETVPPAVR